MSQTYTHEAFVCKPLHVVWQPAPSQIWGSALTRNKISVCHRREVPAMISYTLVVAECRWMHTRLPTAIRAREWRLTISAYRSSRPCQAASAVPYEPPPTWHDQPVEMRTSH